MKKMGRPKKPIALTEQFNISLAPNGKQLIQAAGTVDQWRAWMLQEAERRLGIINPNTAGKFPKGNIHDIETR